jgi:multidrug resistance efflux pump
MGVGFFRTIHELEADSPHSPIWIVALTAVVFGLWIAWLGFARVAVYRSTDRARLIGGTGYEADASANGRVVELRMQLGRKVKAGELLVQLDAVSQRRELEEERTRQAVLAPQLAEISGEIATEDQALKSAQQTSAVALNQAGLEWNSAKETSQIADDIFKRYQAAKDAVAQITILRTDAEARGEHAKADNLRLEMARLAQDASAQGYDRIAKIEDLKQERRRLEGEAQTVAAEINRLQYEIDKHQIRAPIDGRIASIFPIGIGTFVREGDRLAIVVPATIIKAVAEFSPSSALGLIKPGQRAWLHLNGFPWTQYGSITAEVTTVASEPTLVNASGEPEGERIRVELRIDPHSAPLIPIQYGLPGTVEIEVERISPAQLIMRAAGQVLTTSASLH